MIGGAGKSSAESASRPVAWQGQDANSITLIDRPKFDRRFTQNRHSNACVTMLAPKLIRPVLRQVGLLLLLLVVVPAPASLTEKAPFLSGEQLKRLGYLRHGHIGCCSPLLLLLGARVQLSSKAEAGLMLHLQCNVPGVTLPIDCSPDPQ